MGSNVFNSRVLFVALLWFALAADLSNAADAPPAVPPVAPASAVDIPRPYKIFLDGRSIDPRIFYLSGDAKQPKPGDMTTVSGIMVTLDQPGVYKFSLAAQEDGKLFLDTPEGKKLYGARVFVTYGAEGKLTINPLAEITDAELAGLHGLYLEQWNDALAEKIKKINWVPCALMVTDKAALPTTRALPPLPDGIKYLCVQEGPGKGIQDWSALKNIKTLEFLTLFSYRMPVMDMSFVAGNASLKTLDVSGCMLEKSEALAGLKELEQLNLSQCHGFTAIDFTKSMPKLRELNLPNTEVADLTPLDGLPNLTRVNANYAPVTKLPQQLPALKRFDAVGSQISPDDAAAFEKRHPNAVLVIDPSKVLKEMLAGVNKIKVRPTSGPSWYRGADEDKAAEYLEKDPAEVKRIAGLVTLDPKQSSYPCACSTGPFFEFYQDDKMLAVLSVRHSAVMEWMDSAFGNWHVTDADAQSLLKWYKGKRPNTSNDLP